MGEEVKPWRSQRRNERFHPETYMSLSIQCFEKSLLTSRNTQHASVATYFLECALDEPLRYEGKTNWELADE